MIRRFATQSYPGDFERFYMKYMSAWIWILIPLVLAPLHPAKAYLDANTGSYAIQIAVSAIFGVAFAARGAITKASQWVRSRYRKNR